jgi:squalene-hopene/tetraprenyl-beta-curcumene cyclase
LVSSSWIALSARKKVSQASIPTIHIQKEGQSIEWYVVNLLLSSVNGDEKVNSFTNKLKEFQNSDGGWGWLVNEPSDALGTGMALYALQYVNSEKTLETRTRAIEFLTRTQRTDGTWPVNGTKRKKREKVEETSTYWGTAWAIIGLTSGLSDKDD